MNSRKIQYRVIPLKHDAEFVGDMEEVIEVYERPYNPDNPFLCMDEQPVQLIKETRIPVPAAKNHAELNALIMSMSVTAQPVSSYLRSLFQVGVKPQPGPGGLKQTGLSKWPGSLKVATRSVRKSRWSAIISTPIQRERFMKLSVRTVPVH